MADGGRVLWRSIALQWFLVLALGLASWTWGGGRVSLSLLGGGAAVAVPNALFALWVGARLGRSASGAAVSILLGELVKLGLTAVLLLGVVAAMRQDLVWGALIVGVVGALKAHWLALWFTRHC